MIDKRKLWSTVLTSWFFTGMGLFNILFMCVLAAMLTARFAGPEAIVIILMPALTLMVAAFLLGEVVVNFIMDAQLPHPEHDKRYIDAVNAVSKKARMLIKPRAWIVSIKGLPNAMAYGPGLPFMAAIGVSRELVELLDQEELEAVIAHEFGHIKCRDTGILAVISLLLGLIQRLRTILQARSALVLQSPIIVGLGWVIYFIGRVATYVSRFSVSQERELAADALGAYYVGTPEPLISALKKLNDVSAAAKSDQPARNRPLFEDLMVSHPGLEERIASLRAITKHLRRA